MEVRGLSRSETETCLWVGVGCCFCFSWVEFAPSCVTSDLHVNLSGRLWNTTRVGRATAGNPGKPGGSRECNSNAPQVGSCCRQTSFTLAHSIQLRGQPPVSFKELREVARKAGGMSGKARALRCAHWGRNVTLPSCRTADSTRLLVEWAS